MTRSRAQARTLPHPHALGVLMLGAALALVPFAGHAQTAQPGDAAGGQAAPIKNASPAANTAGQSAGGAATGAEAKGTFEATKS